MADTVDTEAMEIMVHPAYLHPMLLFQLRFHPMVHFHPPDSHPPDFLRGSVAVFLAENITLAVASIAIISANIITIKRKLVKILVVRNQLRYQVRHRLPFNLIGKMSVLEK